MPPPRSLCCCLPLLTGKSPVRTPAQLNGKDGAVYTYYHRALLFKVIADQVGLPSVLVRSEYNRAYNVVYMPNKDGEPIHAHEIHEGHRDTFAAFDTNEDGVLQPHEINSGMKRLSMVGSVLTHGIIDDHREAGGADMPHVVDVTHEPGACYPVQDLQTLHLANNFLENFAARPTATA